MSKICALAVALLFVPLTLAAQDTPKTEVYGGFSELVANVNQSSFEMPGLDFSVTENVNHWFGGTLDFSSQFGKDAGLKVNSQSLAYGPVVSYRRNPKLVPFGHLLLGAFRGSADYLNISKPEYEFGVYAGGGLDVKLGENLSLRVIQADYLMTRFSNTRQDNMRISAGLVFRFGHK